MEFFEKAEELIKKKRYNLSVFNLKQAVQLWIKYLIAKNWWLAKNPFFT